MPDLRANSVSGCLPRLGRFLVFVLHALVLLVSVAAPLFVSGRSIGSGLGGERGLWAWLTDAWPRWWILLGGSMRVAGPALVIAIGAGTALALVLFKTDARGRGPAVSLLLLAAMFPIFVTGGAILGFFRRDRWLESALLAGMIHGLAHLPIATLAIGVVLRLVPADHEEAALTDGAGALRALTQIVLRMAMPGVLGAGILVLLWTWTDFTISDVLSVRTFAEETYTQFALQGRAFEPAMVVWPQLLLFGGLLALFRKHWLQGHWSEPGYAAVRLIPLRRWRWPVSIVAVAAAVALAAGPVVSLAVRVDSFAEVPRMLKLFQPEIQVSAGIGLLAGLITSAAAVGIAWWALQHRRRRLLIGAYVAFALAFPAPVLGIGLIGLFNRPGPAGAIYDSPAILLVAHVARFLPVALLIVFPAVRAVPGDCVLAARADGCGPLGVWARIIWPLCAPAAGGAAFAVAALSLGELPCALLVAPPGWVTVSIRFNTLIHYGLYSDSAMLALFAAGGVVLPWMVILFLLRRSFSK